MKSDAGMSVNPYRLRRMGAEGLHDHARFVGLGPVLGVEDLYEVVARIAGEGKALLIVEQFAHEVLKIADRAALMINGRIMFDGSPAEINDTLEAAYLAGATTQGRPR